MWMPGELIDLHTKLFFASVFNREFLVDIFDCHRGKVKERWKKKKKKKKGSGYEGKEEGS